MANIRPSSDLRNHYNEISEFCNKYNEPVYITKNGKGDLVVISNAEYERLTSYTELQRKLDMALDSMDKGDYYPVDEVFEELEREFNFEEV